MEKLIGKDKDGNEIWKMDSGDLFKVVEVYRHRPGGDHWRYTDECPCCGKSICRMCDDMHTADLEEINRDREIDFKEVPVDISEVHPRNRRKFKPVRMPSITLDSFRGGS